MTHSAHTFKEAFAKVVCIPLTALETNDGQLDGLPSNPREIDKDKFDLLKANIKRYPEMLNYRGLIVYPLPDKDGKYIILCGNMRYRAMTELGTFTDAPCQILESGTDIETLKAYTMLDNNSFGKYDWEKLANEWDEDQIEEWGVDLPFKEASADTKNDKDLSDKVGDTFEVVIECQSEKEQEIIYKKLAEEGYVCRILTL